MPPLASEKWGPTIWGPLLQCPAMARSSGTCRAFVMHLVSTKQLHCQYLRHTWWDISKNCCFSTPFQSPFLRVNQLSLHLHLHKRRTQNPPLTPSINMARPTPAAGFAPGSTNSTIFQQTVKPNLRAARPWDIPRSGSRLGQFFGSVRWFFVLEPRTSQKPTLQQKKVLNEIEFSDPSSPDLQQACQRFFSASQLCQLTNAGKLCSLTRKLLISTGKSLTMPKATRNATPWPGLLCRAPKNENHNKKHVTTMT